MECAATAHKELVRRIDRLIVADVHIYRPPPEFRVRGAGADYCLSFNGGAEGIEFKLRPAARDQRIRTGPMTGCHEPLPAQAPIVPAPHAPAVAAVARGWFLPAPDHEFEEIRAARIWVDGTTHFALYFCKNSDSS